MAEKLCELKKKGGGGVEESEMMVSGFINVPARTAPSVSTPKRAKNVYLVYAGSSGNQLIRTNTNPTTGEISDSESYYNNSGNNDGWTTQSVYFTITDNSVSFSGQLSGSSAFKVMWIIVI